jgi:hypothetical protein
MTPTPTPDTPAGFDRRHAVTAEQEAAWVAAGSPQHGAETQLIGTPPGYWVPQTTVGYAAVLDHGLREETRGIVIHVNDGWYHGTIGFFTNGLPEPYGSEGVGAHFEMGGQSNALTGVYADGPPYQFLPIDAVAYHACDANAFSVGIEHAGFGWSTAEWEAKTGRGHYNMIGNSAYRAAWILRRYNLGPPKVSLTNPNTGNVWPHACGGAAWGGHQCPASTQNGVDYFPWELWLKYCNTAYKTKWGGPV